MRALLAAALLVSVAASAEEAARGTITVEVRTMTDKGVVRCALWTDGTGFPDEVKTKESTVRVEAPSIAKHKATCVFPDVAASTYAVTILHDLNGNDDLDRNMIGIPKEPLGFSNGVRVRFAPPKFDDAKFAYDGKDTTIAITVN